MLTLQAKTIVFNGLEDSNNLYKSHSKKDETKNIEEKILRNVFYF